MTTADKLTRLKTDFDDVYNAGYEDGKAEGDSYYDAFWDAYQQNGKRTNYDSAFYGATWTEKNFKPKYDIKPKTASYMFAVSNISGDLSNILGNLKFDPSQSSSCIRAFAETKFTKIPKIDLSSCSSDALYQTFYWNQYLKTIESVVLKANFKFVDTFTWNEALEDITIEGEIGNSVSFAQSSLLTNESAKSIITHLVNYSSTEKEFACSVIFHSDVWARLDALGNDSPNGNTWREYVNDLGWNAS